MLIPKGDKQVNPDSRGPSAGKGLNPIETAFGSRFGNYIGAYAYGIFFKMKKTAVHQTLNAVKIIRGGQFCNACATYLLFLIFQEFD